MSRDAEEKPLLRPVRSIEDPRAMRALAHPIRLQLLDHLGRVESATASECSEALGISPSVCTFHLHALARFGFVEDDPDTAQGRRRPWRAVPVSVEPTVAGLDADGAKIARQFVAAARQRLDDQRAYAEAHREDLDPEWATALGIDHRTVRLSAEALTRLRWAVQQLIAGAAAQATTDEGDVRYVDVVFEVLPAIP